MDYTNSNSFATDPGTNQRLHDQAKAVPTAVSDTDMNGLIWELMEIIKAGGVFGAAFDKAIPATYQKVLTALRSTGVFLTPALFDNSTKAATTAFVRRNAASYGGSWQYSVSGQAIPNSQANSIFLLDGTCASIILPTAASVPIGSVFDFVASKNSCSISCTGGDTVYVNESLASAPGITIVPGSNARLIAANNNKWYVSGSVVNGYSADFAFQKTRNGYQKLPGGLILQWGQIALAGSGASASAPLPIAFPTAVFSVVASHDGAGNAGSTIEAASATLTTIVARSFYGAALAASWIAIGY